MKLPCSVIEDLLPLYHDGICSKESIELVEEHLKGCPKCGAILRQLRNEIEAPGGQLDDLKPLEKIRNQWKKSRQAALKKGIYVTLAAFLVAVSALTAIWYFGYAAHYARLSNEMEKITGNEAAMTAADYKLEREHYQYLLKNPMFLSRDGFVRVTSDTGIILFIYPKFGGEYRFSLMFSDESGIYRQMWLNPDLTPGLEDHTVVRTDKEKTQIQRMLEEKQDEIIEMFDAVYELWGIEYITARR